MIEERTNVTPVLTGVSGREGGIPKSSGKKLFVSVQKNRSATGPLPGSSPAPVMPLLSGDFYLSLPRSSRLNITDRTQNKTGTGQWQPERAGE